jgi:cell division protein FtsI (penicillin-binding protein 3)
VELESASRTRWLARIVLFWAALILARLVQLQVVQHADYQLLAQAQQERVLDVSAPRGPILDRDGVRLAMSVPCESVCVNPMRIPDLMVAAEILSKVLDLNTKQLYAKLRLHNEYRMGFMWVKRKVTDEEASRLKNLKLEWIEFRPESKRVYAHAGLAAHVLGGVDFEEKGESGIERALEEDLAGHAGSVRVTTDVKQRGYRSALDTEATPGKTVRLTIMSRLQYLAQQELKKAVDAHHCKSGSLVAMNPKTGEILALANYPTYDPNIRPKPGDPVNARENLAVSAPFEPGSVFKVITISAALETTNIKPTTVVSCGNGSLTLFGRTIHDHNSYASLPVEDVLARSSNIGAINIGLRVGDASMYEYVRRFGFGKRTGLGLPGESAGIVRPLKRWQRSSIGSVAMGHEVSVTSVQLAQACSIIANGGYLVRPKLVMGSKTETPIQVLKPQTAITMRRMMEGVILKPYGTGHAYVHMLGYTAGGKTGTAQIYDFKSHLYTHLYNASFMGFAPVTDPAIVVVVTVNGASGLAGYGGPASAPVFGEVAAAALRLLDVPRDLPDEQLPQIAEGKTDDNDLALTDWSSPVPQPLAETESSGQRLFLNAAADTSVQLSGPVAPNFLKMTMRDVVQQSSEQGIPVDFAGRRTGLVRSQHPAPGEPLGPGQRVRVNLGR